MERAILERLVLHVPLIVHPEMHLVQVVGTVYVKLQMERIVLIVQPIATVFKTVTLMGVTAAETFLVEKIQSDAAIVDAVVRPNVRKSQYRQIHTAVGTLFAKMVKMK